LRILKERASSDESPDVRRTATQELARDWREDPEIFESSKGWFDVGLWEIVALEKEREAGGLLARA